MNQKTHLSSALLWMWVGSFPRVYFKEIHCLLPISSLLPKFTFSSRCQRRLLRLLFWLWSVLEGIVNFESLSSFVLIISEKFQWNKKNIYPNFLSNPRGCCHCFYIGKKKNSLSTIEIQFKFFSTLPPLSYFNYFQFLFSRNERAAAAKSRSLHLLRLLQRWCRWWWSSCRVWRQQKKFIIDFTLEDVHCMVPGQENKNTHKKISRKLLNPRALSLLAANVMILINRKKFMNEKIFQQIPN